MTKQNRKLDWKPRFDEKSKQYGIREIVDVKNTKNISVLWKEGTVLDQGSEGACVGFGWAGEVLAEPVAPSVQPTESKGNSQALTYYRMAKRVDEWPGENYDGTSVLAGAKVMRDLGFISEYRWCFSIEDLRAAVISEGPVVIGIPWYDSMYYTDSNGMVVIAGEQVGGHCLTITGYISNMLINGVEREVFRWRNSWGSDYGINGSAFITYEDLESLVRHNAEMCVPMGRRIPSESPRLTKSNICSRLFDVFTKRSYN